jgi:hypothetical protein
MQRRASRPAVWDVVLSCGHFTQEHTQPGWNPEDRPVHRKETASGDRSWAVTAELEVPPDGAEGVIVVQGGRFGGWSLYAKDGRATFYYNVLGITSYRVDAAEPIPTGTTQVRMEFAYDGGGIGKGGTATLYYDGKEVGSGRIAQTRIYLRLGGIPSSGR